MKERIKIDQSLKDVYPEIRLGCLSFTAEVTEQNDRFWEHLEADVIPGLEAMLASTELGDIPGVACSRAAYKAFGRNPGRYRVSSEALLRRIRSGKGLYHVNSVVDVNNMLSMQTALSYGSYDIDHIAGDVVLKRAGEGEGYYGIGKDFIDMENMLVLSDDEGIFGSSYSDSHRALISTDAKNILVVIYCFSDALPLEQFLDESEAAFSQYAGAENIEKWIVN